MRNYGITCGDDFLTMLYHTFVYHVPAQTRRSDFSSERRGYYSVTAVSSAFFVSGSLKGSFTVMVVPFSSSLSRDISPL